ncbi:TetR/AcrR family transcriptional regulator [Kibdelosporangium phytohabitans]|uniref:Transcriptional regulator n=1 Tax=Kibdelosporangium phytohabitans TaxID=860235 RepID=A0A0N9ICZ5_9PSEU|nr:TetR/AcrR family transcriptional regulator [Kibdelosporangium phytohabitans]ALG13162.1 transcriptional regulator [Kibdelosporangium phytohabitans]MBE1464918.1 AcrR family transcriptional regulator [Kibdelosporangium phytohabitans]
MSDGEVTDKRLLRGARTRQIVLREAVDTASLEGLEGVSFGGLATATGVSKAGVQTLFRTKEALQLSTIDYARELFIDAVVAPARPAMHGIARLRALIDNWIAYIERPTFSGGCFWVANLAEYDSKPGPIRDALKRQWQEWLGVIAAELRHAVVAKEIPDLDADLTAFQIDAVLNAANTALFMGVDDATDKARRIVEGIIG